MTTATLAACGSDSSSSSSGSGGKTTTVGFLYVGPKNDFGYNQAAAEGAAAVAKIPGVKILEAENVPETSEAARVMEKMIRDGASIIFPTSYGHLEPALTVAKRHPDVISDVCGAGALFGVFLDGGPKALDLVARLAPGGFRKDPNFRTKLITCAVVDALYRDHDVYTYYTLNGRNPLVAAPSLVATPEDIDRFLHALDDTLSRGMTRLLMRFVRQKVGSLW